MFVASSARETMRHEKRDDADMSAANDTLCAANTLRASVVIPVRNGLRVLPRLLSALMEQTLPQERFEVIVGDDGSTDGSTDSLETDNGRIRVASGPPLTSDAARNRAARLASSDALVFVDADCLPDPGWLATGLDALREAEIVGGFIRADLPDRPTIWTLLDIDTFVDQERSVKHGYALTGNLFVRRELFNRVGGFDETLHYFGDFDFAVRCRATGARIAFSRNAAVSHPTYNEARSFLRKVWSVNRSYGWYEGRAGRRPDKVRLREWVPLVQPIRSRRSSGRSMGLDRKRLQENGVGHRVRDDLLALPIMYLVMPYLACLGQLAGWREGRRDAGADAQGRS
jgi:glycosyltransferase involved in cell wall biosynthesis